MSIAFDSPTPRPSRADIEPVALDLIRRRGAEVLSSARRYASTPDDAEDAYQRALEILLTKAPTTSEEQLLPWLKTVVRHECYALRKRRERDIPVQHDELDAYSAADSHAADERAERYDRLRIGAEALGRLKPQETRALLLKAEGLSYQEIAARTGWSYTKVNRCLVEGRRAFVARVEGIESGAECERLRPLLSALADGEASAADLTALRPHLKGCPSCRAELAEYRDVPRKVAGVAPAGGLLAWLAGRAWGWVRPLFEGALTQKAAVVAVSTVAVAGTGAATVQVVGDVPPQRAERPAATATRAAPPAARVAAPVPSAPARAVTAAGRRASSPAPRRTKPAASPRPAVVPQKPPPTRDPAPAAQPATTAPAPAATPAPRRAQPAEPPDPGSGEFGP